MSTSKSLGGCCRLAHRTHCQHIHQYLQKQGKDNLEYDAGIATMILTCCGFMYLVIDERAK